MTTASSRASSSLRADRANVTAYSGIPAQFAESVEPPLHGRQWFTRLALTFDDRISFVLTEKLEIKRIDFLDVVKEKLDEQGAEDARALFDAGFALMTGELGRLLPALLEALGGELKGVDAAPGATPAELRPAA